MIEDAKRLLDYIEENIGIRKVPDLPDIYHSLPVCILDDIYSLQSHYETMALPAVKRYAKHYLNNDIYTKDYTIDQFINDIDRDGKEYVMNEVLKNRQVLSGRRKIEVCYDIAKVLQRLNIQTMDDFRAFKDKQYLDYSIRSVKGVGNAAIDYLFMMVGDDNRVKPDIHIHHCIKDALGYDVSDEMCQILFREASALIIKEKPYATPRYLDGLVWAHYSKFEQ